MVGCEPALTYDLTITSTTGGNVTAPGEGVFIYDEGTAVNLTAEADECYRFVNWTGGVATVGNITAATTIITMNGTYSIMANFEEDTVVFPDANLEGAIREAIAKPDGPIYTCDLKGCTVLGAASRNISDLTGLEYCTNLTNLDLMLGTQHRLGADSSSGIFPHEEWSQGDWVKIPVFLRHQTHKKTDAAM